jgi:hypothetical protein
MKAMSKVSQEQLIELRNVGHEIMYNFCPESNVDKAKVLRKIQRLFHLLLYIGSLIQPSEYDSVSFVNTFSGDQNIGPETAKELSSIYDEAYKEEILAFEVAFIYFLSLRSHLDSEMSRTIGSGGSLTKILKDKQIGTFFIEQLSKIRSYYEELNVVMFKLVDIYNSSLKV